MSPSTDCPTCPSCSVPCGVPIRESRGRFRGPEEATLFCPACGSGWVGSAADEAQAEAAQAAWDAEQEPYR